MPNTCDLPITDLTWKSSRVFELSVARQGISFSPGDSVAIFNRDGTVSKPYSIASSFHDDALRFLIQHFSNGVVSGDLAKLSVGDVIKMSAPFGWFRPGQNIGNAPFTFVATGTGIAPFLSYMKAFPERAPAVCLYGVKKLEDALELDYIQSTCDTKVAVSRENGHPYHNGRVTDFLPHLNPDPAMHYYLCGLDAMIDDVSQRLESAGIDFTNIHREVFFNAPP